MVKIHEYFWRYQGFRGRWAGLPGWGRVLVGISALPGIVLMGLSMVAVGVSILALLLLTWPVYRLLVVVSGGREVERQKQEQPSEGMAWPGRRHVDVKIIDESQAGLVQAQPVDEVAGPERT